MRIEKLSGYEFTKTKARVSRRSVQVFYDFTEDEVTKFIELSKEIALTKDLDGSVKKIWGDLDEVVERNLERDLRYLSYKVKRYKETADKQIESLERANTKLVQRVYALEETVKELQEEKSSSLFNKLKKRGK